MTAVADFHRLEARLRLSGTLVTRTGLRIGSGGASDLDAADLPVLKDADGFPFVPGASLKGALRSTIESLVRGAEDRDAGIWACDPLAEGAEAGADRACGDLTECKRRDVDTEQHCPVCRLLGSNVVASHVRFCDAMIRVAEEDRRVRRIPVEVRDGVSIDRDLKTVYKSRKYDFEVVSPGTSFALEVFVENPRPWLMGLLMMGFDQMAEGFTAIGGFTSRGLGRVDIAWSGITRVTARDLLDGKDAGVFAGEAMATEMAAWRQALAGKARGDD